MGLVFSVCAHLFACVTAIQDFGDEALKQAWLPRLASGEWLGANAITEVDAGSDVFALTCRALRDGGDYVIDGSKSFVTNAPAADVFLVYAVTNPAHGYLGVSAFVVPRKSPGVEVGPPFDKIGLRRAPAGQVRLEKCRVPASNLVGEEGQGALVFRTSMIWERACLFAGYVGMMEEQLEKTIAFAKERRQFGKPIGKHQAVAHRIADMKLRLESARLLVYRACWSRDRGASPALESSLAKLAVSEAAVQSGMDALRVHGGRGTMAETGIADGLFDALPSLTFSGTSDIQRDLIARELGL
jgi:alkylation response protein AidB-like acyl-CoA dehydrogenase